LIRDYVHQERKMCSTLLLDKDMNECDGPNRQWVSLS